VLVKTKKDLIYIIVFVCYYNYRFCFFQKILFLCTVFYRICIFYRFSL